MKRVEVNLALFLDEATGDYGLAHEETYADDLSPFNAFWSAIGIFHDIWEHNHELNHKYFRGRYALNVGGEMTAMGSMWYYVNKMGISCRLSDGSYWNEGERMRQTTQMEIEEAIRNGYCYFGDTLECAVPYQKPTNNSELEYQIETLYDEVKNVIPDRGNSPQDRERGYEYKKSVTLGKIQRLHRYGFYKAARWVPNNSHNRNVLYDFFGFWDDYTKNVNASELYNMGVVGFKFVITKSYGEINWKAYYKGGFLDGKRVKDIDVESLY